MGYWTAERLAQAAAGLRDGQTLGYISRRHGKAPSGLYRALLKIGVRSVRPNTSERFWRLAAKGPGCWLWRGGTSADGYGMFKSNRGKVPAHRHSYEINVGPIPAGLFVCHRCDNPPCVRPDHLFIGDHKANMSDMVAKGRARLGETNGAAKLTRDAVLAIRCRSDSHRDLARQYGCTETLIRKVRKREVWKHVR